MRPRKYPNFVMLMVVLALIGGEEEVAVVPEVMRDKRGVIVW